MMNRQSQQSGFTAIELMMVLVITAVLAAVTIPSFSEQINRYRLKGAASNLYTDLQYARSEAVQRNNVVRVDFTPATSNFCYVIYIGAAASCTCGATAPTCTGSSTSLKNVSGTDYSGIGMATSTGLAVAFEPRQAQLDASGAAGTVTLTGSSGLQLQDEVNLLGRARLCTPAGSLSGFPTC